MTCPYCGNESLPTKKTASVTSIVVRSIMRLKVGVVGVGLCVGAGDDVGVGVGSGVGVGVGVSVGVGVGVGDGMGANVGVGVGVGVPAGEVGEGVGAFVEDGEAGGEMVGRGKDVGLGVGIGEDKGGDNSAVVQMHMKTLPVAIARTIALATILVKPDFEDKTNNALFPFFPRLSRKHLVKPPIFIHKSTRTVY